MTARPSKRSQPGAIQRMVLSLRPAISDLFEGYGIPQEETSFLLRDAVVVLATRCEEIEQPRSWLLRTLEDRCKAYVEAREAEEREDEEPASDA